jgi:hypothetical protein
MMYSYRTDSERLLVSHEQPGLREIRHRTIQMYSTGFEVLYELPSAPDSLVHPARAKKVVLFEGVGAVWRAGRLVLGLGPV